MEKNRDFAYFTFLFLCSSSRLLLCKKQQSVNLQWLARLVIAEPNLYSNNTASYFLPPKEKREYY